MGLSSYYANLREAVGNERIFMPCVVAIIRDEEGRILFQHLGDDNWSLPAGAIEPGEAPAQAVLREVWEETGLLVRPTHLVGVFGGQEFQFTYDNGHQVEYSIFVFQCETVGGTLQPVDDETVSLHYFHPNHRPPLALPYPECIFEKVTNSTTYFQWDETWFVDQQAEIEFYEERQYLNED